MWQNFTDVQTLMYLIVKCEHLIPNLFHYHSLSVFLFEFSLSSCNSINYFSIVSCIPFFLISFSVLAFSLLNHQRYFCSFTYCGRVCKHNLTKRISKCKHLWCICTKSFELLSLIKLFGLIILFWNHTFKCTSEKWIFQNVVYCMSQNGEGLFLNTVSSM